MKIHEKVSGHAMLSARRFRILANVTRRIRRFRCMEEVLPQRLRLRRLMNASLCTGSADSDAHSFAAISLAVIDTFYTTCALRCVKTAC